MTLHKRFAVVIPAYNEAATITAIINVALQYTPQVIVVDDGSTDDTYQLIKDLPITLLRNDTNLGKDTSLMRGMIYAQSMAITGIITLDADGQHNPHDIPRFINTTLNYQNHLIIGARLLHRKKAPCYRRCANRLADFFISWIAGKKIVDTQSGFRYYPMALLKQINWPQSDTRFVLESQLLIEAVKMGFIPVEIPIAACYTIDRRKSYFRPFNDTLQIAKMLLRQSFLY